MELKDAIRKRKSVRKFKPDPVPQEVIEEIIDLASLAPSAGALRPYRVVITDKQLTPYPSPVSLVVCAIPEKSARIYGERGRSLYAIQDATLVGGYLQLLATDAGLATVWVGAFREGKVRWELKLEEGVRPIAIIVLGYEA